MQTGNRGQHIAERNGAAGFDGLAIDDRYARRNVGHRQRIAGAVTTVSGIVTSVWGAGGCDAVGGGVWAAAVCATKIIAGSANFARMRVLHRS